MALSFSLVAVASLSSPTSSQPFPRQTYSPEAESKFANGLASYAQGDYGEALSALEEVSAMHSNQRSSAALLLVSRALVRLERYREALEAARRIEIDYRGSRYTADARLVAGDCYYQLNRYREAAAEYARLLATPGPLSLQASAAERLAAIVRNRVITTEERERIGRLVGAERFRDAVLFGEARWYARLGWHGRSRAVPHRLSRQRGERCFRRPRPQDAFRRHSGERGGRRMEGRRTARRIRGDHRVGVGGPGWEACDRHPDAFERVPELRG